MYACMPLGSYLKSRKAYLQREDSRRPRGLLHLHVVLRLGEGFLRGEVASFSEGERALERFFLTWGL